MDQSPIDIPDIIGELEKIFGSDTCGIFKPCTLGTKLSQTEYLAIRGQIDAPKVILHHLQAKRRKELQIHPPEMQQHAIRTFTKPSPTQTLGGIPQHVRDNAAKADHKQGLAHAGIKKQDSRKSIAALNKIDSTMARLEYMSKEEREQVFVTVQAVVLLNIITALIKEKQPIGANIDYYRRLEIEIRSGERSIDDMYKLIHEYILYMYHTAPTPINTSDELLQFIKVQLPVLLASLSPYYQREKDIIAFKIYYLPLLQKYIELVLRESLIVLKGDSIEIAESIMEIIREHICAFVRVAGDPAICIRHTIVHKAEKLIIEGVRNFLSDYIPPTLPPSKRPRIADDDAGGSLNRNRSHSPIKKYKNRTKHRTMRRTKYRTKCKTKYRTSRRYKIKNKKTNKRK